MPREKEAYRDTFSDVLEFFNGKRLLTAADVARYAKIDRRTVQKRYSFNEGYISATVLARELS